MQYDVIIVGGRVAGAALAARLAEQGKSILIVDRATFPSPPTVPSSPFLHPGTMAELDKLGIAERAYATVKVKAADFSVDGSFTTRMHVPVMHGRDYFYGVHRSDFDFVLWQHVAQFPNVTRIEGFTVTKLDGGIEGKDGRVFKAPWVVGADGRYSTIAKLGGARVVEDRDDTVSTVYYSDWVGASDADILGIATDGRGSEVLMVPGPHGRVSVNTHQRADIVDIGDDVEAYYERTIMRFGLVRDRLKNAKRVDRVTGIKRIGNRFLTAGGPGWVLVGDAWHHKDPVDGQGIYDALIGAKILGQVFAENPADIVGTYEARTRAITKPMFDATVKRLHDELYKDLNGITKRLVRHLMNDELYATTFLRFIAREIPPGWMTPKLVLGAVVRGLFR